MNDRLYRSVDDRVLAGVAGGLADKLGIDPALVRIVWALLAIASSGIFLVIYIVMAIVVPEEDDAAVFPPMPPVAPPPGSAPAWGTPAGLTGADAGAAPGAAPAPGLAPLAAPGSGWVQQPSAADIRGQARAQRRAARAARRGRRDPGQGGLVLGVILILVGAWFLVDEFLPAVDLDRLWPFGILVVGVVLLVYSFGGRMGRSSAGTPGGTTASDGEVRP